MRAIPALPRRKSPLESSLPGIAHWQFQDSATTTVVDGFGLSNLTASSTSTVSAPVYASDGTTAGLGRDTSAVNINGASNEGQRTMLAGDVTVEALVDIASLTNDAVIFTHENAGGGTSNDNALARAGVMADGRIWFGWESGAGVNRSFFSKSGAATTGLHHLAFRRRTRGSNIWISFFVDGLHVGTTSTAVANAPSGGSSGRWNVGSIDGAGTQAFQGKIYDLRILNAAMSSSLFQEDAARALRSYDLVTLLADSQFATYARILVEDPTAGPGDGTDTFLVDIDQLTRDEAGTTTFSNHNTLRFLETVTISDDIDSNATMSFEALREIYDWSISPGMQNTSPVQSASATRLLELARRVRCDVAIVPYGWDYEDVGAWDWVTMFDGFVSNIGFGGNDGNVKVDCRDLIAPVSWTFCRPLASNNYQEKIYGDDTSGTALQTVIQAIIDDHVPATGMKGGTPSLYTPTSPGWNLRRRAIGFEPLLDVITNKAEQIGWVLRPKFDDVRKQFRLTLYEPARTSPTVLKTFGVDDYEEMRSIEINEESIRNVCEVVYTNRLGSTGTLGEYPRDRYVSSDSTSIATYGERYCQISEDMASQIDTSTEAQKLADATVKDLALPKASVEVTAPFLFYTELNDYYSFTTNGIHYDTTLSLAVVGFTHTFDNSEAWAATSLKLRGLPAGGVDKALGNLAMPGVAPYAPFLPVATPASLTVTAGERLGTFEWTWPTALISKQFDSAEIHLTTAAGAWTPSSSTLKAITRGNKVVIPDLDPTKTYQAKVIFKDKNGNKTSAVAASDFAPKPGQYELGTWLTRQTWAVQAGLSTTLQLLGVDNYDEFTPDTKINTATSAGRFLYYPTSTTLNSDAGVDVRVALERQWLPVYSASIMLPSGQSLSSLRLRLGLWDTLLPSDLTGSASPTVEGFGFFLNDSGQLSAVVCDGATLTSTAVGSSVALNTRYDLACGFLNDANTLVWFINGQAVLVSTATGTFPASNTTLKAYAVIRNTSTAGRTLAISRMAGTYA